MNGRGRAFQAKGAVWASMFLGEAECCVSDVQGAGQVAQDAGAS